MKNLVLLCLLLSASSSFAKVQTITCTKKGEGFYYIKAKLLLGHANEITHAVLEFKGQYLTPGLYPSQYLGGESDSNYNPLKISLEKGKVLLTGFSRHPGEDEDYFYAAAIPPNVIGKKFTKGAGGLFVATDLMRRESQREELIEDALSTSPLDTCWSVVSDF